MSFKWTCPFCNYSAIITADSYHKEIVMFENAETKQRVVICEMVECPTPDCNKFVFSVGLYSDGFPGANVDISAHVGKLIKHWDLIPSSSAKAFPSYVPKFIIDDYEEACMIKELSPKASATLSRRCLQGMIRDFWNIKKKRLIDEILELKDKVDPSVWEAIDSVREVGNIGAHMEKDVNLIIDIEPNEADTLINLIEFLIEQWYIQKHEQEKMLKEIKKMADQKIKSKKAKKEN